MHSGTSNCVRLLFNIVNPLACVNKAAASGSGTAAITCMIPSDFRRLKSQLPFCNVFDARVRHHQLSVAILWRPKLFCLRNAHAIIPANNGIIVFGSGTETARVTFA